MNCSVTEQKSTCGSFPTGCRIEPLTSLGQMLEGARLSMYFPSAWTAALIFAPESGKTLREPCLWHVDTCMLTVGAGVAGPWASSESLTMGNSLVLRACALGVVGLRYCPAAECFREHTLAKFPDLPQLQQAC